MEEVIVHSGSASIPVEGGATISDRLAAYGISHEAAKDGCRYLSWQGQSIGAADAFQAIALLDFLDAVTGAGTLPAEDFDKMIEDCKNPSPASIELRERLNRARLRVSPQDAAA